MMLPAHDEQIRANGLLARIRSAGVFVSVVHSPVGLWSLWARDGQQAYRLSGESLLNLASDLARQVGLQDLD